MTKNYCLKRRWIFNPAGNPHRKGGDESKFPVNWDRQTVCQGEYHVCKSVGVYGMEIFNYITVNI